MFYKAPVDHVMFLLNKVLGYDNELYEPILNEAAKLCEEVVAPTNQVGDKTGCFMMKTGLETPEIITPLAFKEPWKQLTEGGWLGLSVPEEYGGQGMPYTLAVVLNEFLSSSNMAFSLYGGLTRGAIQAILVAGTEEQKKYFIPNMASGKWTGTMNLTEPHCGTDLGLIKTKAVHAGDDVYAITGQKIFISCGDHDLSENIIHLVLARIEGAPEGVKGLSLFAVPKFFDDGKRNKVTCGSIEHKMGIHGSSTCVMDYDSAVGCLIGQPNQGLQAMFIMMNEARLGVAVQGLSQSELAYQNALFYAKDRFQGSKLGDKNKDITPIINHPDIRRMLLDIKCINEPARLLILEAAMLCDENSVQAQDRLGLLTPILKGVLTDYGFDNAVKAQQIWGGHGYIQENGMEQIVRDARIAQIYEGTNGIQALDLVARKLPKDMGRALKHFSEEMTFNLFDNETPHNVDEDFINAVRDAFNDLKDATRWLTVNGMKDPNNAGSAAYDYMHLFGLFLLAKAWIGILNQKQDEDTLLTAKHFKDRILPETKLRLARIKSGSDTMMKINF